MLFYGIASGCEAIGAASGWNEALYRTWYLTGAVWTAGWLGLGTAFLLGRTRFGYTLRALPVPGRAVHVPHRRRSSTTRAPAARRSCTSSAAVVLALAVAVETYFQNDRWPTLAARGRRRGDDPVASS